MKPQYVPVVFGNRQVINPSLSLNFLSGTLDSRITFSRGTQGLCYGPDGTLQYAPNNLLTYSNQADNAAWTKSNSFVQTNLVLNSDTLATQSVTTTATPYTLSFYGTGTVTLSGTSTAGPLVGTGAANRVTLTFTPTAGTLTLTVTGSVTQGQLVQGSVPGNYVATTSAALPCLYADYNGALRARKLCENTTNTAHAVLQTTATIIAGSQQTFSIYLRSGERTKGRMFCCNGAGSSGFQCDFDLVAGTATAGANVGTGTITGTPTISNLGGGNYRVWMTGIIDSASTTGGGYIYLRDAVGAASYTGDGSSGIYIADAQLTPGYLPLAVTETTSAAVYGPRFDYDPVTKVARGLLIEEQRANLLLQSNTFNVTWTASTNTNVTSAATTSPEGVVNAWRLYGSNGLSPGGLIQGISKAAAATQYTWSIYAKAAGYNWIQLAVFDAVANGNRYWFNLSTGVLGSTAVIGAGFTGISATITNIGNGWYRCTLTATSNAGTQFQSYAYPTNGDGVVTAGDAFTDGTYIYGAQLEAGAFATSYIPTLGSTATRNADSASITTLTPWYNASAGTLFASVSYEATTNGPVGDYNVSLSDGTVSNLILIASTGGVVGQIYSGGVNSYSQSVGTRPAIQVIQKSALAYAANDANQSVNGVIGTTDATVTIPSGINKFGIGQRGDNSGYINGWIGSLRYYPTRLVNASLQSITA